MGADRILRVVVGDRCSLCDVALDRLRTPANLLGLRISIETLDVGDHRDRYATRVPVVLDPVDRVLAEGRISTGEAWWVALAARLRRFPSRDSGT